jgi:pyruvate,water dikinase
MRRTREEATEEVFENIGKKFLGSIKVEALKFLLKHTYAFLVVRDDERWIIDRLTWAKKLTLKEVGRRLFERGLIEREDDFYFLSLEENWELLKGGGNGRLVKAKIAGRRENFDRFDRREAVPSKYIVGGQPVELDVEAEGSEDGSLLGMGTSRGSVTGKARVLHSMGEIGTIEKGDILVCNSTDPGWTPVFLSIGGLVLETGGMLAHGSCLSREYGLPAVQVANATKLIPDGALITVDGGTGAVTIDEQQLEEEAEEAVA